MRRIAYERPNAGFTPEELFYKQALAIADLEDDYSPQYGNAGSITASRDIYGDYFSGFQQLNVRSMRSYITWRTKVRRGDIEQTRLKFALAYISELIHCIGFSTPEEAYDALNRFIGSYSEIDERIGYFCRGIQNGFVIYYGLPNDLLTEDRRYNIGCPIEDWAILLEPENYPDNVLIKELDNRSRYSLIGSAFYAKYPDELQSIAARVYRSFLRKGGEEFIKEYIGTTAFSKIDLFGSLLFFDHLHRADYTYSVNAHTSFRCSNGRWSESHFRRSSDNTAALSRLLRNIDYVLRERYAFTRKIKPDGLSKELEAMIDQEILAYKKQKREEEIGKIVIDMSKLNSIRTNSSETAELLLAATEEDAIEDVANEVSEMTTPRDRDETVLDADDSKESTAYTDIPELSETESILLKCLVSGEAYTNKLLDLGTLPSIAADGLNEKLFDTFGDTVIIDNGTGLEIIEDYLEELKGIAAKL